MLEDHLYWVMVYWRWMNDANFERGPANFFKRAPAFIRPLVKWKVRGNVRRNLHAHGISRHNEAEMTAMSDRAFDALSQVLGDNKYLMGERGLRRRCDGIRVHRRRVVARCSNRRRTPRRAACRISPRTAIA